MLWQRVVTALLLLPLVLGAIFLLPTLWFALAMIVPVTLAGREWANLSGDCRRTFLALQVLSLLALTAGLVLSPAVTGIAGSTLLWIAAAFWCWALLLVVRYPAITGWHRQRAVMTLIGLVLLVPAWYAVVYLQALTVTVGDRELRGLLLLGGFLIVWGADVGAYFAGRAFGRHKLAVQVSPGKSIEGAVGGLLLTLLLALALAVYLALPPVSTLWLLALVLLTTGASILGDLFESMVKRQAGVKDSGNLLPGHGGMLDRIDSITCALPVFALGYYHLAPQLAGPG